MRVVELGEMKLVGLRVVCPGDQYAIEIPKATLQLENRLNEISCVANPEGFIGAFVVEELSEADDGYWVCVEVDEFGHIPEGMDSLTIPAQKYATILRRVDSKKRTPKTFECSGFSEFLPLLPFDRTGLHFIDFL
ncbi:GyrI-like domain-containing protein [Paenibacillus filicis]|uniref:GyrI-like domain-containing protein n=1 Tax=Paenibacillus filicis TaxID=669464 RepID=A0ABU9DFT9_9BACL